MLDQVSWRRMRDHWLLMIFMHLTAVGQNCITKSVMHFFLRPSSFLVIRRNRVCLDDRVQLILSGMILMYVTKGETCFEWDCHHRGMSVRQRDLRVLTVVNIHLA